MVLEHSNRPLSLRRVPPNLLVGSGATDFADEIGIPTVHPDILVSPAAGERYKRWRSDLNRVGTAEESEEDEVADANSSMTEDQEHDTRRDAQNLELSACWNESQPYSPSLRAVQAPSYVEVGDSAATSRNTKKRRIWSSNEPGTDGQECLRPQTNDDDEDSNIDDNVQFQSQLLVPNLRHFTHRAQHYHRPMSSEESDRQAELLPVPPPPTRADTPSALSESAFDGYTSTNDDEGPDSEREDDITDTVGAIAIDCYGNIAAGSSSGGIGMKHRGRVGPAALVGIGTAVVPIESDDNDKICVATVTSGTGEHMATTMAAGTCASRLYASNRRTKNGSFEPVDDDTAICSFVDRDFMGKESASACSIRFQLTPLLLDHPSVKHSHSAGAIGILGVKKTKDGVYLYFAHNTDSFVSRVNPHRAHTYQLTL